MNKIILETKSKEELINLVINYKITTQKNMDEIEELKEELKETERELKNKKNDYTFQVNLKNRFSVKTDMTEKLIKKVIDALKINCNHEEKILADESFEILNMIRIEEDEISQKLFKRFESKEVK